MCGGAINSPQLLQLSGVGPAGLLREHGIDVVADLPGVGENLQDHLEVYVQYACKQPVSMAPALKWRNRPMIGAKWLFGRTGPGGDEPFRGRRLRQVQRRGGVPEPDVPLPAHRDQVRRLGARPAATATRCTSARCTPTPAARSGSSRPTRPSHPALRFNYLSTDTDRREWAEAIRVARDILNQPALAPYNGGELSPGPSVATDEQILDWVRRDGETALHPSCTCAMGTGEMSVVDPATMAVHGIDGLKVVDASVMPYVTNGNIYAPVMMVAEKAADLILGNQPLAAGRGRTFYQL